MGSSAQSADSRWMTVDEVASYLKLGRTKVYQMAQNGELPGGKVGGQWRFDRKQVDSWLERRLKHRLGNGSGVLSRFDNVVRPDRVVFLDATSKVEALETLVDRIAQLPGMPSREEIAEGIFHREDLMSTGIGLGVGVPHIRLPSVRELAMVIGVCKTALADYESIDGEPVWLIFMIVAGVDQQAEHLRLVAKLSSLIKDEGVRHRLRRAESPEEVCDILLEQPDPRRASA